MLWFCETPFWENPQSYPLFHLEDHNYMCTPVTLETYTSDGGSLALERLSQNFCCLMGWKPGRALHYSP